MSLKNEKPISFSIVLPVRNGAQYLRQTIDSVLEQTYTRWELVILENASTDQTVSIIQTYTDRRISMIRAPSALSIEDNWARIPGLDLQGYVTFISHDDLIYPGFLDEMARLIQAEPGASLYQTSYHFIDESGQIIREAKAGPPREQAREMIQDIHSFNRESVSVGYVARRDDFKAVGGFPKYPGLLFADLILWYRLVALSYKASSPQRLAAFRLHQHNATRSSQLVNYYQASKRYLVDAARISPYETAEDKRIALHFIMKMNSWKHRQVLEDLIIHGSRNDFATYQRDRDVLAALIASTPEVKALDSYSAIYDLLAAIPVSLVRKQLFKILKLGMALRRRQKPTKPDRGMAM